MTFSYNHFNLGNNHKWVNNSVTYHLDYTTRAQQWINGSSEVRIKSGTTITSWQDYFQAATGSDNASVIQQAIDALKGSTNLFMGRSTSASGAPITIGIVEGLELFVDGQWRRAEAVANPVVNASGMVNADILLNKDILGALALGQSGFATLMHEIGHALGLFTSDPNDHPHLIAPTENYTHDNTIMSYENGTVAEGAIYFGDTYVSGDRDASTAMLYDIATLQKLYGVKIADAADSYTPTGAKKAWTLWDGGTDIDTLDVSGLSWTAGQAGAKLDLCGGVDNNNVPRFSEIKDERIALAFDPRHYTDADITKPLLSGKSGVVDIEVAKGGSGNDTIIGGYVSNALAAYDGHAANDNCAEFYMKIAC